MKTLVHHSAFVLGMLFASACSPEAEDLCKSLAACGTYTDTSACLDSLGSAEDAAKMEGCGDEFDAAVVCESHIDFTCSDNVDALYAADCSAEDCEWTGCKMVGGAAWHKHDTCRGDKFDPTGDWYVDFSASPDLCGALAGAHVRVMKSGDSYTLSPFGIAPVMSVTGTVAASVDGAVMHATFHYEGPAGTDNHMVDETVMFDATATAIVGGTISARFSGTGTAQVNGCSESVSVGGLLHPMFGG